MKQFTFYSLYAELLDTLNDEERGKITRRMCVYIFNDNELEELEDKKLKFLWGNIIDFLETDKQAQSLGKTPKGLNRQMAHFTIQENFHEAMELMDNKQSGQYVKAIYNFMFDGKEPKLVCQPKMGQRLGEFKHLLCLPTRDSQDNLHDKPDRKLQSRA